LGLGEVIGRSARHSEVLLTKDALNALYEHLNAVANELATWILIWFRIRQLMMSEDFDAARPQYEADLLNACAQYQSHRSQRRSLSPLPDFPSELEMQEAWDKARAAEEMPWFQPLSQPIHRTGLSEAVKSTIGIQAPPLALRNDEKD
jgi:hypothetical protein